MFIYSALYFVLLPIFIIRTLHKDYKSLKNKLGFGYQKHSRPIHFHCVSVGEFNASIPLIDKFLKHNEVVITTTTQTGRKACLNHYGNSITHYYFPFDLGVICKKFLTTINPQMSVILETEIWANFLTQAQKQGINTYLVNGRLSNKSLQKYQKFSNFSLQTMHKFSKILVQDELSNTNFKQLGVKNSTVVGNLKFDIYPHINNEKITTLNNILATRSFVVFASTHAPEEELIIQSFKKQHTTKDLLVIIPRHPQRFKEVENMLIQENIQFIKQSDNKNCDKNTQVLLADSMGVVLEYYSLCKLAFIGGSLSGTGGHNMLEAIAFNKLCVFGEDVFNFKFLTDSLLQNKAAIQIATIDDIWDIIQNIDNDTYQSVITNATKFMQQNTGISQKIFDMLK